MAQIKKLNLINSGNFYIQQRSFAAFKTTSSVGVFHVKTNIPTNDDSMWMIEAVGYNYGRSQSIRTSWVWYSCAASFGYQGYANVYPGMTSANVYASADGKVCLSATLSNSYFIGFILNAYRTNNASSLFQVEALAYIFTTTTANQY